jgi:hypothetical protein
MTNLIVTLIALIAGGSFWLYYAIKAEKKYKIAAFSFVFLAYSIPVLLVLNHFEIYTNQNGFKIIFAISGFILVFGLFYKLKANYENQKK